jgi:uncharacterized membrane protein
VNVLKYFWAVMERHSRAVVVIPCLLAILTTFLTGRTSFFEIGVLWFLSALSAFTGVAAISEAKRKRRYGRRAAITELLQFGGYSFAAASMAAMAAFMFWAPTSEVPRVLGYLMFAGIIAWFSSVFVYKSRARTRTRKTQSPTSIPRNHARVPDKRNEN